MALWAPASMAKPSKFIPRAQTSTSLEAPTWKSNLGIGILQVRTPSIPLCKYLELHQTDFELEYGFSSPHMLAWTCFFTQSKLINVF